MGLSFQHREFGLKSIQIIFTLGSIYFISEGKKHIFKNTVRKAITTKEKNSQ